MGKKRKTKRKLTGKEKGKLSCELEYNQGENEQGDGMPGPSGRTAWYLMHELAYDWIQYDWMMNLQVLCRHLQTARDELVR